jgi:hypothetical protein
MNVELQKNYIVTHMTIARQRLGKNIPAVTVSTILEGHPLLSNESIYTHY